MVVKLFNIADGVKKDFLNPQVIAVWSPSCINTAHISYELSKELSQYTGVLLAELPCLGVPRLGFVADIRDRENNTETVIQEFDKKKLISGEYVYKKVGNLAVLPACVYAVPDNPVTNKVELETLFNFPAALINEGRKQGYPIIVFECQGQLSTPMTFSALKNADTVIIPLSKAEEVAFTLINLTRIYQVFNYSLQKFKVISASNFETLSQVMAITDEEGNKLEKVEVLELNYQALISYLTGHDKKVLKNEAKNEKKRSSFNFFRKKQVANNDLRKFANEDKGINNEGLIYEEQKVKKIKL